MAAITDRQKKALGIFQFVLELLLGLFKAHHAKDLDPVPTVPSVPPASPASSVSEAPEAE